MANKLYHEKNSWFVHEHVVGLYVLVKSCMRFRVNPLYSCLNVKELLAWSTREIWSLRDYNWTRTYSHLVRKRTLNHLAKLEVWLNSWVFVYELSGCRFESSCSHLNIRLFSSNIFEKNQFFKIKKVKHLTQLIYNWVIWDWIYKGVSYYKC